MMRSSVKDLQEQNFYRWGKTSYENQDSDLFGVLEECIDIKENEEKATNYSRSDCEF